MSTIAAVVPAAGLSTRMKRFKPLLPLMDGTVVSSCIDTFKRNGVDQIVVVTGKRADEVAQVALLSGAETIHNEIYEEGMFTSIQAGVRALREDVDSFFVLPVDIPLVRRRTVARMLEELSLVAPKILYPRFRGERGHPPLIDRSLIPAILAHDGTGGLRAVLENHEAAARDLDVVDFGTVHDLDHPEDYQLAQSIAGCGYPLDTECDQLYALYDVPSHVIEHCRAVAQVAGALSVKINENRSVGAKVDVNYARAAALVHDVAKGQKKHEQAGARLLEEHGFYEASAIVLDHSDLWLGGAPLTERELVFLADKLVKKNGFIPIEERYASTLDRFAHDPEAVAAIQSRRERAMVVFQRFELETGESAETVAKEALA